MKRKKLQPRLHYPARISFRFDGEIKTFTDKQKLREFSTTKPTLQQMLKNFSRQETQEKEKTANNKPKSIKKMVIGTYISITTLSINGLNAPTKRHRLAEWIQKQDPYICCLLETHFRPRDTQTESEGMEKDIPCKWKSKESWSSNSHITQNRR